MKMIGIVMRIERFDSTFKWFINETYVNTIVNLGAAVFPICSYASLEKAVNCCDGCIIPGGYDIQSYYLNERRNNHITTYEKAMDHFDLACIDAFFLAQKPILGICRGMQLINVYLKGTILQHIDAPSHAPNHMHEVKLVEQSFLKNLYQEELDVNSFHHQIVQKLGVGLKVSALSIEGYVEAFEHVNGWIFAVQWHPEKMDNDQILPYFLDVICS